MKKYLISGIALLLASCAGTGNLGSDSRTDQSETQVYDLRAPLKVPDIATLKETSARKLVAKYVKSEWSKLPGWADDDAQELWLGMYNNCRGLMRPVSGSLTIPARATPRAWHSVCSKVATMGPAVDGQVAKKFIQTELQPWAVFTSKNTSKGTVTGYYEPVVKGSRVYGGSYQWPMYSVPSDLITVDLGSVYPELTGKRVRGKIKGSKLVPYDTREQFTSRNSKDQSKVIVYLDDPVEAFFLQVQGSGRVLLPDGKSLRLAYADHNGRPYSSIGKWLADKGELPISKASMQNIKAWAAHNPSRIPEMLNSNQALVFFREEPISDAIVGPKGAYGIPLIAKRAIAVDPTVVPLGSPVYLSTTMPASKSALRRVVFAQDTGAAIKGIARADFYWGSGPEAGQLAGHMKQDGFMWILWPKNSGQPSAR
ncbi:murein transglycosylase A [Taylorella equigenitalis]|uniref:murein transglycosylase A n=1 Tax=Taylorella equigenitalis TaxID=29575 RepID=UPI00237E82FF|nr:MltA domain-containing protein [Taylorella equigenitalis]WDU52065.1 murein transglycosylase A [Taylorella equigenitalis]